MNQQRTPTGAPIGAPHVPSKPPRAGVPTELEWNNEQVATACMELDQFASERHVGATGYKAAHLRRALEPINGAIREQAIALVEMYQREEGPDNAKVAAVDPSGRPLPPEAWSFNPGEYREKDKELLQFPNRITAPVRFSYEELIALNPPPRGNFWHALYDVIDPPRDPSALIPYVGEDTDDAPPAPPA